MTNRLMIFFAAMIGGMVAFRFANQAMISRANTRSPAE